VPGRANWDRWLLPALFLAALALRLFRLSADPLWLDELYGVQLGRLGFGAILGNSLVDPHPPLYYLLLWLGSGFSTARSEWAYRWIAVLAGALTVPLVYRLARRVAGPGAALGAALVVLLSPVHVYYSQESRAYALTIGLAAFSAWVLLTDRLAPPARWQVWGAVTAAGLLLDFAYLLVAGVQIVFVLIWARRQAGVAPALVAVGGVLFAIAWLATRVLPHTADSFAGEPLRLWSTAQALTAGDLARYGPFWGHTWLTGALAGLFACGTWRLGRRAGTGWALYPLAQVLLPLGAFFLIARPLLNIDLHLYEARQFLVLLPAALLVIAAGLEQLRALLPVRWGRWPAWVGGGLLLAALVWVSAVGLGRYWGQTKSPEGQAAVFMRDQGVAGSAVVSLHYAADAALSFYAPRAAAYFTKPQNTPAGLYFADSLSVQLRDWPEMQRPHPVAEIGHYPRRWVVWESGVSDAFVQTITAGCTPVPGAAAEFAPFKVVLVDHCPPLD
jgi:hypothetical protein